LRRFLHADVPDRRREEFMGRLEGLGRMGTQAGRGEADPDAGVREGGMTLEGRGSWAGRLFGEGGRIPGMAGRR